MIHGNKEPLLQNIVTYKYPSDVEKNILITVGISFAPKKRFIICATPKKALLKYIAFLVPNFSSALNKNPLQIISSMNPMFIILKTKNITSRLEHSITPSHKLRDAIKIRGEKYKHSLAFLAFLSP